eukprot:c10781_g1_i2.p1 GENE.c10781_g1_i2~~c10781_g1_i2.p1  ORF type:complete len:269 (-),score=64.23 c10781_g1_i2:159-965(-)
MSDAIGMMEGAYFVSRSELLNWLNNSFGLNYTKVEQCCSAAAHCQVIDAIYPGTVAMDKVVWDAKSEYQYVNNFKILQKGFDKNGIKRYIDVEKLVKGKYQDNLEFLQWIKAYFDMKKGQLDPDYDPIARRSAAASATAKPAAPAAAAAAPAARSVTAPTRTAASASSKAVSSIPKSQPDHGAVSASGDKKRLQELQDKVHQLELQASEDQTNMENLVKERDFYFNKLRDIEVLCQGIGESKPPVISDIIAILYAVEDGFEGPPAGDE